MHAVYNTLVVAARGVDDINIAIVPGYNVPSPSLRPEGADWLVAELLGPIVAAHGSAAWMHWLPNAFASLMICRCSDHLWPNKYAAVEGLRCLLLGMASRRYASVLLPRFVAVVLAMARDSPPHVGGYIATPAARLLAICISIVAQRSIALPFTTVDIGDGDAIPAVVTPGRCNLVLTQHCSACAN